MSTDFFLFYQNLITFFLSPQTIDLQIREMKLWIKSEYWKKLKGLKISELQSKMIKFNFLVKFEITI